MEPGQRTDWLRAAAPHWSLAGDEQLLQALQALHQRITSRCADAGARLAALTAALARAHQALHNVNNKFLSLSNRQFVESRVYEDDGDLAAARTPARPEPAQQLAAGVSGGGGGGGGGGGEAEALVAGVRALRRWHETVTILRDSDSDSESDSDSDGGAGGHVDRVVLKPLNVYASRPLPHVIGSRAWRDKWHAGLVVEESDSDSSASGGAGPDRGPGPGPEPGARSDQYSVSGSGSGSRSGSGFDSDAETVTRPVRTGASSPPPPQGAPPPPPAGPPPPPPAAVAAELARRLAAVSQPAVAGEPPSGPSASPPGGSSAAPRKLYAAHRPAPGVVFSDSPPPLDDGAHSGGEGEGEAEGGSPPEDIFAELRRGPAPARGGGRGGRARIADELFGAGGGRGTEVGEEGDIFRDRPEPQPARPAPAPAPPPAPTPAPAPRKPVGGVSVFGAPGAADVIGAALLRRPGPATPAPPTSDPLHQHTPTEPPEHMHTQKDIFDDLFAKSEQMQKRTARKDLDTDGKREVKAEKRQNRVDLFSDNLFDDIDDIFTSDVPAAPVKMPDRGERALFDDDDDLFADIAVTKTTNISKPEAKPSQDTRTIGNEVSGSIFDSDDDLFSDKPLQRHDSKKEVTKISEVPKAAEAPKISKVRKVAESSKNSQISKETKGLFDDSDDDMFSNIKVTIPAQDTFKTKDKAESDIEIKPSDVNSSVVGMSETLRDNINDDASIFKDDGVDLFLSKHSSSKVDSEATPKETTKVISSDQNDIISETVKDKSIPKLTSTNIFDEDDTTDELFVKSKKNNKQTTEVKSEETKSNDELQSNIERRAIEDELKIEQSTIKEITKNESIESRNKGGTSGADTVNFDNNIAASDESQYDIFNDALEDDIFTKPNRERNNKDNLSEKKSNILEDESIFYEKTVLQNEGKDLLIDSDTKNDKIFEEKIDNRNKTSEVTADDKPIIQTETEIEDFENNTPELNDIRKENILPHLHGTQTDSRNANNAKLDNMREVDANKNFTESEPTLNEPDIFSDVFDDLPPEFEKPKEPKRSKNVNALFDDDSDDEALFFKKNDAILDEKPEDFISKTNTDLFGVFHDEPPAIDVDFLHKSDTVHGFDDDIENEPTDVTKTPDEHHVFDDDAVKNHSNHSEDPVSSNRDEVKMDNELLPELPQPATESIDIPDGTNKTQNVETKKVGKLKAMSFNINVNTLLPGASPKKTPKPREQIDGQAASTTRNDGLHTISSDREKEVEPKLVKTVSFEGDPDSPVLDNKVSKQRAKIQVRRRPSTRRARLEAVKVSGIDFGEDSTDNSSSIDDPPKNKIADKAMRDEVSPAVEENKIHKLIDENNSLSLDTKDSSITGDPLEIKNEEESEPDRATDVNESSDLTSNLNVSPTTDVKSKLVYILNDEDIFTNSIPTQVPVETSKSVENKGVSAVKPRILQVVDDDDDIFKDMMSAPKVEKQEPKVDTGIRTLGKVYTESKQTADQAKGISVNDEDDDIFKDIAKVERTSRTKTSQQTKNNLDKKDIIKDKVAEAKPVANKKSIFDDLSDEENELFNAKKTGASKKTAIFNSDSEEDLFAGKSKRDVERETAETRREIKKVEVKRSLFGDEDDDDLFGARPRRDAVLPTSPAAGAARRPTKEPRPEPAAGPEPEFCDPLSQLAAGDH